MSTLSTATVMAALLQWALATSAQAQGSNASVAQTGTGNLSLVSLTNTGDEVSTLVIQNGNNNVVGDPQSGTGGVQQSNAEVLRVEIRQSGDANRADITQTGGWRALFYLDQSGDANTASVLQDDNGSSVTRITQTGSGNRVESEAYSVGANGYIARQTGVNNDIRVYDVNTGYSGPVMEQQGASNLVIVQQDNVFYSTTRMNQLGNQNQAIALHNNTEATRTTIDQTGNENIAYARRTTGVTTANATITQTGDSNLVIGDQSGWNTDYNVLQNGQQNTAIVQQAGVLLPFIDNSNVALITQTGNGHYAALSQSGVGNRGSIVQ